MKKPGVIILGIFLFFLFLSPVYSLTNTKAAEFFKQGKVCLSNGDFPAAIENFKKALKIDENYLDAIHLLGIAYKESGQLEDAKACFQKAIKLRKNFQNPYLHLADIYIKEKDYEKARETINEMIKESYRSAKALYALGIIEYMSGNPEKAIEDWTTSVSLDSEFASNYENLGIAYYNTGKVSLAINKLKIAISHDRKNANYHFNLAWVNYLEGNSAETEQEFNYIKEHFPNSLYVNCIDAINAYEKKEYDDCLKICNEIIAKDQEMPQIYYLMAKSNLDNGAIDKVKDLLNKVLALDPNDIKAKELLKKIDVSNEN